MNPVIGLDISKGQSEGQAFLDKGNPYGKTFCFLHTLEGLRQLLSIVKDVQKVSGMSSAVILESTGHYHQAVVQFLEEHEIVFLVVNPLISYQAKKSTLRKVKTGFIRRFYYFNTKNTLKIRSMLLLKKLRNLGLSNRYPELGAKSRQRFCLRSGKSTGLIVQKS